MKGAFRSLAVFNYRLWAAGALVSNIGTWMQRVAQHWLVLTQLTAHNAAAVGIVMSLQYGPQLVLLPWTGHAADHLDRRKLLIATQALLGALAFGLGVLTTAGTVALWHVYLFALLFGCVTAFDAPARHTFVAELVGDANLSNAVALNSTSFNAARMIGPAVAGICIAALGTGWAFMINGVSFVAVVGSLLFLRQQELHRHDRGGRAGSGMLEGFRYVWHRPDLRAILVMLFLIGTFGLNFQIFISTMAVSVFHVNAAAYGMLTSTMAVGTIAGALLAAGRERPRFELLWIGTAAFGTGCAIAALMPNPLLFGAALIPVGVASLTITNSSNSLMQLATEPAMRGRVMAIRLAIVLGATPLGAPLVGWTADRFGPRCGLGVGAASGFVAAIVGLIYLYRHHELRVRVDRGRLRVSRAGDPGCAARP